MKRDSTAGMVSIGGVFTTLAVLFHASPVLLPVIGLMLSPFAALPTALATIASICLGLMVLFTSTLILFLISPQEAIIFLLATGPLGFALGASFRNSFVTSAAVSAGVLLMGMNILTYAADISAFGDLLTGLSVIAANTLFIPFSILYSGVWVLMLRHFVKILKKSRLFDLPEPGSGRYTLGHRKRK